MRDARKYIEAAGGAGDRLRDQLARDAGERDAVTGEALQEVDVGGETAEVGRAIQGDVHVAAPGVVDAHVLQLREYTASMRARVAAGASNERKPE